MNCLKLPLIAIGQLVVLLLLSGESWSATLVGKVQDDRGQPISGAVIDIYTAKPRTGTGTTCPSCYRDCVKEAKTDADGKFVLEGLDGNLLFRVLVMAPGRRSELTQLIDPDSTDLDVQLKSVQGDLPHDRVLRGRVQTHDGRPLAGAVVWPAGAKTASKRWWGQVDGVDEASITDQEGRFVITSREPKLGLDLRVRAPGYADLPMQLFELDGREQTITMQLGASVMAHVEFEGKPLIGRAIGIVQVDRSPQSFVGELVGMTDGSGNIQFHDLQPNQRYVIYSLIEPVESNRNTPLSNVTHVEQKTLVLKAQALTTAGPGEVTTLKNLSVEPGQSLSGRIVFPAGALKPDQVKIRLDRDPAWDWCERTVDTSGDFSFQGLPAEAIGFSVTARGYEIDASEFRYQVTGPSKFALRLRSESGQPMRLEIPMQMK